MLTLLLKTNHQPFLYVSAGLLLFISTACYEGRPSGERTDEKIDNHAEGTFKPETRLGPIQIREEYNLILVPTSQNFVKENGKTLRIAINEPSKSTRRTEEFGNINYEWRRLNQHGRAFQNLFVRDRLVLNMTTENIQHGGRSNSTYMLISTIDADTNQNDFLDQESDLIALYIVDLASMQPRRISPDSMSVLDFEFKGSRQGIYESVVYRGSGKDTTYPTLKVDGMKKYVYFQAYNQESKIIKHYLYIIKTGKLEEINQHLQRKYIPELKK